VADPAFFEEVDEDARRQAVHLRERVLNMPDPQPLSMFDHVYSEGSPLLDEQREQLSAYLASFEGSGH
jgi:pyruvate dehydrogenase E1 component alpha subunit